MYSAEVESGARFSTFDSQTTGYSFATGFEDYSIDAYCCTQIKMTFMFLEVVIVAIGAQR